MKRAEASLMLRNQREMDLLDHPDEHLIDDEPDLLSGADPRATAAGTMLLR